MPLPISPPSIFPKLYLGHGAASPGAIRHGAARGGVGALELFVGALDGIQELGICRRDYPGLRPVSDCHSPHHSRSCWRQCLPAQLQEDSGAGTRAQGSPGSLNSLSPKPVLVPATCLRARASTDWVGIKPVQLLGLPWSPVVKTPHFQCRGRGLIPGLEIKIPCH